LSQAFHSLHRNSGDKIALVTISPKKYGPSSLTGLAAEWNEVAKSQFLNILAVNPWLQRFYPAALRSNSRNSYKAKNLAERYPIFVRGFNLMALNPHVKICTHVKVTGVRCGSPALRGARFCYFHERMLHGVPTPKHARIHPIALLENEEAIQVALMEVINAVLRNAIDNQRANLILRALHIAVRNSRRVRFEAYQEEMVHQTLEPYPDEAPAAALGRIPLPRSLDNGSGIKIAPGTKLRRSERMQPTAQAVGTEQSEQPSPGGAKEMSPGNGLTPESKTKTAAAKNPEGAPSLRSGQGWAAQKPAAMQELSIPRKRPGRVTSAVVAQTRATQADARSG
jgi:hypothetical protein